LTKANLSLYANPLGDLYVEWKIPVSFLSDNVISIDLPTYKYEMSIVSGIPIPLSSIAESIESKVFGVFFNGEDTNGIEHKVEARFKGRETLVITLDKQLVERKEGYLLIQYVVKKLVTKDKVFFNFVFTITSPLPEKVTTDINIIAHFSYHISSYRFKTAFIHQETGRIEYDTEFIKHWRTGDFIYGTAEELVIPDTGCLDLHVHGSRLPFKIDRRIFWILVFVFTLVGVSGILLLAKLIWDFIFG